MEIRVTDDFDLKKITFSGQCFRAVCLPGEVYRFITGGKVLYIKKTDSETYSAECAPEDWHGTWIPYFDLSRSYSGAGESIPKTDTFMRKAYAHGKGIRICRQEPWETLISFIISQRKSIPAIKSAIGLVCGAYGECVTTPYEKIHTFPSPESIRRDGGEKLKSCLLGYRLPYVLDAVEKVCSGQVDLTALAAASDEALLAGLKTVKGVGDKVAACTALYAYGRSELAPVDVWIHRIMDTEYGGANPFPQYGGNAGIMQQYAFYYAQSHKKNQ